MAIVIEKKGKTISEAVMNACEELGVSKNEVEIEVVREDSKGIWGIGGRDAVVRVEVKTDGLSEKAFRAKKTLETLLGFISYETPTVKTQETETTIEFEVWATKGKRLIVGKSGEVVRSLEYLTGRISSKQSKEGRGKKVVIKIAGAATTDGASSRGAGIGKNAPKPRSRREDSPRTESSAENQTPAETK